ncbi:MAG: hypothetical protein LDL39_06155 [Magnetospirillum sp.]|nr:hypothetical protein [Magnetospirillum sp.]
MSLPTNNSEWGFFGTIHDHADQAEAWNLAMTAIQTATDCPDHAVRDFLDSTSGRHFADDIANGLFAGLTLAAATKAAVSRWMEWKITRRTSRETGIPSGLPYLTGFVAHFEIMADVD